MSWFSRTEDYSIEDTSSDFYDDPEITYGSSDDTSSSSSSSSASGAWDDYQHEREYVSSCCDQHTR